MEQFNVLITSCGRRVELVKTFIQAKQSLGINGIIVGADMSNFAPALYFCDKKELVPRLNDISYVDRLIEIINTHKINLVVPTIDTELQLLADNKVKIEQTTGAKVMISSSEVIKICNDKFLTAKFFKDNGFETPYTLTQDDIINKRYNFPLFIKPLNGSSSINAFKVNNQKELDFFIDYIEDPIVQEMITGKEYTIDAFTDFEGNILSVVPRIRIATRGGEILKGQIDLNNAIISNVTEMLHSLKPIGHITIQGFLGEDNVFRYIEINPRFGGGAPMSIVAGANTPKYLYQLLSNQTVELDSVKDKAIFVRFDNSIMLEACND